MLPVLLVMFMFSEGLSVDNCGRNFITAFPENVAFYYYKTQNYLRITSLHPSTSVTITYLGEVQSNLSTTLTFPSPGQTMSWNLTKAVEEHRFTPSNKSVLISSTSDITVLSVSGYPGKFQSHVVQPIGNLGTAHQIPTLSFPRLMSSIQLSLFSEPRFNSFRLLIINAANSKNKITIKKVDENGQSTEETQELDPYNIFQLQSNGEVTQVNGADKLAVMLTHPCFETRQCLCSMVLNQILPRQYESSPDSFPVPFSSAVDRKQLFLTTDQSVKVFAGAVDSSSSVEVQTSADILPSLPALKESQLISTTRQVSLRLVSSGLILELIPKSMFSGCYLVNFGEAGSWAVVIAKTSSTALVKMNSADLPSPSWSVLTGSDFSWANVSGLNPSTIWHPESKIAVYMIEKSEPDTIFGRPAIIISREPDVGGCMASPGFFHVGNEQLNWFMAREFCISNSYNLAMILHKQTQDKLVRNGSLPEPTDGWIGLRRDIYTREWYWRKESTGSGTEPSLTENIVTVTYWADGEPDVPERGLCASVSLDTAKNFTWRSARCCSTKKPICYRNPVYITVW